MPELSFRNTCLDDAPLILDFLNKLAAYEGKPDAILIDINDVQSMIFERRAAHAFFGEINAKPIGLAIWAERFSPYSGGVNLLLIDIFIEEEWRGQKLGSLFFDELKRLAVANDYKKVEWYVDVKNAQAKEFYKKQGGSWLEYSEMWNLKIRQD